MAQLTNVSLLVFSSLTFRFDPLMVTSLVTASIPFGLFNLSFCDSSLFYASSPLRLAFIMTSVIFCCLTASGLFCKWNWWFECKQYNNKWRCHSSQTCLRKNMTNSLLYLCLVQSLTCKLDLWWEKCKKEQPQIKMSQLTDVFILVFILLIDCN